MTITRRVGKVSCLVVIGGTCRLYIYFSVLEYNIVKNSKHLFDVANVIETVIPKK